MKIHKIVWELCQSSKKTKDKELIVFTLDWFPCSILLVFEVMRISGDSENIDTRVEAENRRKKYFDRTDGAHTFAVHFRAP